MGALPPLLILDDDADDIFILRRLLLKAGVNNKIVAFEDARAACLHLEGVLQQDDLLFQPCVVFTDLNMAGMDGFEFARWIRRHPRFGSIVIVMVTASEDPANAAIARAAGVDRLLAKYPTAGVLQAIVAATSPAAPK